MDEKFVEKHYCYDRPAIGDNGMLAAMMANGGMGGAWNNPFIYLVWMMMLGRNGMWGGNDNPQLQALQNSVNDNHNNDLAMQAIAGNSNAIRELAQSTGCSFNALNQAICGVRSAIDSVAGKVGYTSERVINAINQGDCGVIQAIKDCCCGTQKAILEMGYQSQLANCNQTNTLLSAINTMANGMERGFSSVAYETQKQTCDILNAGNANTQRIIDVLNGHWSDELQRKYADAQLELSQMRQNAYLISQLKTTATT